MRLIILLCLDEKNCLVLVAIANRDDGVVCRGGARSALGREHPAATPIQRPTGGLRLQDLLTAVHFCSKSLTMLTRFKSTLLYVALIVAVNYGFTVVPLVKLPDGTMWPPMSLAVGFIFVVRDFAQREVGHKVLAAMLAGAALSYVMASPYVAIASAAAFLVSELVDWLVYSLTKRPLSQRILYSSLLATPIDSAVFLYGIGHLSTVGVLTMTASKLIGALIVWWLIRRRESYAAA